MTVDLSSKLGLPHLTGHQEVINLRAPIELRPQPGPQTQALSSSADYVIFGGG